MKNKFKVLALITIFMMTLVSCNKSKQINIVDIVKTTALTTDEYNSEIEKHMDKEIFEKINIYNKYNLNEKEGAPFAINFKIEEKAQKEIKKDIYAIILEYDLYINKSNGENISASTKAYQEYTVKVEGENWIITDVKEYEETIDATQRIKELK